MKKALRILLYVVIFLVALVGLGVGGVYAFYPRRIEAASLTIDRTPQRIARGQYLANNVAGCVICHSEQDLTRYSGPPKSDMLGSGGTRMTELDDPFTVYSRNITPAALGAWTDGEIVRAITCGESRDGSGLFPIMPYDHYRTMDQEDVYSIVAYLRTLKPIDKPSPPDVVHFPFSLAERLSPGPAAFVSKPAVTDKVAYGQYLVNAGLCALCHTPSDNLGQPVAGKAFSGGTRILAKSAGGHTNWVVSANLTPDPTGLGNLDEDQFVAKFKAFDTDKARAKHLGPNDPQDVMPWFEFSGMTDQDLRAIYAYLRTLPPVSNKVDSFPTDAPSGSP